MEPRSSFEDPPPAERDAQARETFRTAVAFHRAGRLAEAQERFRQTLQLQPTHVQAMVLLAVLLLELNRPQDALELTARALAAAMPACEYRDYIQVLPQMAPLEV